jgi:hypothetical protein
MPLLLSSAIALRPCTITPYVTHIKPRDPQVINLIPEEFAVILRVISVELIKTYGAVGRIGAWK